MRPLSHSSISLYRECPRKYKFKYVDKLPEKPKSFFSFGRSVHSALESFYSVPAPPAPSLEDLLAQYRRDWVSEGYKDPEEEARYYAEGERILRGFHEKHAADFKPPFFAEFKFELRVDGIPVIGFVDRIDKTGPDRIAIVDYKTGKGFDEERVRTDAQLTMYQMACEELLGLKVESLTFYHLNSLTPYTVLPHSGEQVRELRERIVSVAEAIGKGLFEPRPEERRCSWCDYKPYCPAFQGFPSAARSALPRLVPVSDGSAEAGRKGNNPRPAPASDRPAPENGGEAPRQDEALAELVDRYGSLLREVAALRAEAEEAAGEIVRRLKANGWIRAFGTDYDVTLLTEEKWEFQDKGAILEAIRNSGRWEDILAPSAPLVTKLLQDPALPGSLRRRLEGLARKVERAALKLGGPQAAGKA